MGTLTTERTPNIAMQLYIGKDEWRIGEVKVTRIVELEGPREPDYLFPGLTPDVVRQEGWLRPQFATEDGRLLGSIHAFILESGGKRIVVDTCVGNDKPRRRTLWNKLTGDFLARLAAAGYPAESIDAVLCTHLHIDHVGWNTRLVDGRWVPTFPNARYLFGRAEWQHWSQEQGADITGDVTPDVAENVLEARVVYEDSVRPIVDAGLHDLVDPHHRLTPEIWLEPTPGHTPGHVSVGILSQGQVAFITGDMMHHPIQMCMPELSSNFDWNRVQARVTRQNFLGRNADRPVLILGTHFPPPTAGWIVSAAENWRLSLKRPD
jgi:glyoxylase-like metal-dependent hydrolase (beta-lactamase superfamily II)